LPKAIFDGLDWQAVGTGDLNRGGHMDIPWQWNSDGKSMVGMVYGWDSDYRLWEY